MEGTLEFYVQHHSILCCSLPPPSSHIASFIPSNLSDLKLLATYRTRLLKLIIESVDSICRNGTDLLYM